MSKLLRTTVLAAAIALVGFQPTVASADTAPEEPCAKQSAKVQKAEDALARVTAVFDRQKAKVKKVRGDVADAETKTEKKKAKQKLAKVKAKKAETKKTKKAQQMRLTKAQARYDACMAEQSGATPAP
ncbi:hypothetical protein [Nocardioides sp.]|uniref:hypothetical protein n=1 Tax=Nocardioides sp. TaxID=35761 RepID=UPI003564FB98